MLTPEFYKFAYSPKVVKHMTTETTLNADDVGTREMYPTYMNFTDEAFTSHIIPMHMDKDGKTHPGYKKNPELQDFNIIVDMTTHRTNFTIKSNARPHETKSFDHELQFKDYWGTPFFTATPNGTIALAAEGPHPCTRTDRASRFTPCVGRFVGIGTAHPVEKLHLVGTQYIESGELSLEERENENNYTITARGGMEETLKLLIQKANHK